MNWFHLAVMPDKLMIEEFVKFLRRQQCEYSAIKVYRKSDGFWYSEILKSDINTVFTLWSAAAAFCHAWHRGRDSMETD